MPGYIDGLIDSELPRACDGIAIALNQVMSDAISVGAAGGSRMFIQFQTVIGEHITSYSHMLRGRLSQFDAKHAPFTVTDFDKAITSIDNLAAWAAVEYARRRENNRTAGGGGGLDIDEARLATVVTGAQNELRGLREQFRSQRSFWKSLEDQLTQALGARLAGLLWTALVFVAGILALAIWNDLTG